MIAKLPAASALRSPIARAAPCAALFAAVALLVGGGLTGPASAQLTGRQTEGNLAPIPPLTTATTSELIVNATTLMAFGAHNV